MRIKLFLIIIAGVAFLSLFLLMMRKVIPKERNGVKFPLFGKDTPLLGDAGVQPKDCNVKSITKMGRGSQPDWSWDGSLVAYSDEVKQNYEVFVMNADGL